MALIDGDDFVSGDPFSFQEANRMKNHWRQSDPKTNVSNPSPGMLESDADDDKLYHVVEASGLNGFDEVLQKSLSADVTPAFDNLILDVDESDVSDPPTDAELDALFPAKTDGFVGFVKDTSSAGPLYIVAYYGGWYYVELTLAV